MINQRFVTYETNDNNEILIMSESEYMADRSANAEILNNASEFVWQFAETKEQALSQHIAKHDEWQKDPTRETY